MTIIISVFLALLFAYIGPTLIAARRRHRNLLAIFLLNLLLGWTALGWIAALVWSVVASERRSIALANGGYVSEATNEASGVLVALVIMAALYSAAGLFFIGVL